MRLTRIAGLCLVAVFAIGLMMSATASAAKPPVRFFVVGEKGDEEPENGDSFTFGGVKWGFNTSVGKIVCPGTIIIDYYEKGLFKEFFSYQPSVSYGASCPTTTPLGNAVVTAEDLPWKQSFTSKGKSTTVGAGSIDGLTGKPEGVRFKAEFPEGGGASCVWEAKKVKSSFVVGTPGLPVAVEPVTNEAKFKSVKAESNPACPKEGKLSSQFTTTVKGGPLESE
jgi:hypothetical protein